jgi:hypothetical protein
MMMMINDTKIVRYAPKYPLKRLGESNPRSAGNVMTPRIDSPGVSNSDKMGCRVVAEDAI